MRFISAVVTAAVLSFLSGGCAAGSPDLPPPTAAPKLYMLSTRGPVALDVDTDLDLSAFKNAKQLARHLDLSNCKHEKFRKTRGSESVCSLTGVAEKVVIGHNPNETRVHDLAPYSSEDYTYVIGYFSFASNNHDALEDMLEDLGDRPTVDDLPGLWDDSKKSRSSRSTDQGLDDQEIHKLTLELSWSNLTEADRETICLGYRTNEAATIDAFMADRSDISVPMVRQFFAQKCN